MQTDTVDVLVASRHTVVVVPEARDPSSTINHGREQGSEMGRMPFPSEFANDDVRSSFPV